VATAGFVFSLGFLPSAVAATIYVPDDYPTIQAAVDAANPGDTIIVSPGIYTEQITINKDGIRITSSSGPGSAVISADGEVPTLDIYGKEIALTGFTVRASADWVPATIMVHTGAHVTEISDCDISGFNAIRVSDKGRVDKISESQITAKYGDAVYVKNQGSIGTIEKCEVKSGNFGIMGPVNLIESCLVTGEIAVQDCPDGVVRGNTIRGPVWNVGLVEFNNIAGYVLGSSIVRYNTIHGCIKHASKIIGNVCGSIVLDSSDQSLVENNLVRTELAAACTGFFTRGGMLVPGGGGLVIRGNVLERGVYLGAFGAPSRNVVVEHNCTACVATAGSSEVSIIKNTLTNVCASGYSIDLEYSENVWVYLNNVVDGGAGGWAYEDTHHFESIIPLDYTYGGRTWSSYLGNYWGETVSLVDANNDGIGDEPLELYCPFHCVYDHFPLVQPANFYLNEPPMSPVGCRAGRNQEGKVVISWANPADMDLQLVRVVRRLDRFPQGPFDGTQIAVFQAPSAETEAGAYVQIIDDDLEPEATGYYAVFVKDYSGLWNEEVVYGINAWKVTPTEEISPPGYRELLIEQIEELRETVGEVLESYSSTVAEMVSKSATFPPKDLDRWININKCVFLGTNAIKATANKEDAAISLLKLGLFISRWVLTEEERNRAERRLEAYNDLIRQLDLHSTDWRSNYATVYSWLNHQADLSVDNVSFTGIYKLRDAVNADLQALEALLPEKISSQAYLAATRQLERLRTALLSLSKRENISVAMDSAFIGGALWTAYRNYNILYERRAQLQRIAGVLSWVRTGVGIGKLLLMLYTGGASGIIELVLSTTSTFAGIPSAVMQQWVVEIEDFLAYLSTTAYEGLVTETTKLYDHISRLHECLLQELEYKQFRIIETRALEPTLSEVGVLEGTGEVIVRNDSSQDIEVRVLGTIHALRVDTQISSIPIGIIISDPYKCLAGEETSIPFEYRVLPPKASGTCTYLFSLLTATGAGLPLDVAQQAVSWSYQGQAPSTELHSGVLVEGESRTLEIVPEVTTSVLTLALSYGGSDLDLHVYDSAGNHVGLDYDTMTSEVEIPGASYSGAETLPEIVRIRVANPDASYTVRIVGRSTPPDGEPYALLVVQEEHIPAIPSVQPDKINVDAEAGETIPIAVNLLELGQQVGLKDISTSTSGFQDPEGNAFPGISWQLLKRVEDVPPGGMDSIFWEVSLPEDIDDGTYTGQIHIFGKDDSTGNEFSFDIPVTINVGVEETHPPESETRREVTHGPNPVPPEGCIFWLNLPDDAVEATLKIFDVDGALLVSIPLDPAADRYPETGRWIPQDDQGRLLGTGLYLYCVEIKHADGTVTYSPVQKMVIQR